MTNPNSLLSRIRKSLANKIEPKPDLGEAWCIDCRINSGRTAILSADGLTEHALKHQENGGEYSMNVQAHWPARKIE